MPIEHAAELSDLRERALKIAEQIEREVRPRTYPGELHVPEAPASSGGAFQDNVRVTAPKPGEFDPTRQQKMAADLRKLVAAVDHYLAESGSS